MARWSLAHYNRFLGASMSRYALSRKDAAQHYREMRSHLNRTVTRADLKAHPIISKRTAAQAFALKVGAPPKPPARRLPPPEIPEEIREEIEEQEQEAESSEDYESS